MADRVIVSAVENLSMIGAKAVEILMTEIFYLSRLAQIARIQPVHDIFAIPFA